MLRQTDQQRAADRDRNASLLWLVATVFANSQ